MRNLAVVSLLLALGCAPDLAVDDPLAGPGEASRQPAGDLLDRLRAIEGMTVVGELSAPAGFRFISLRYDQPVHHWDESQGRFEMRLTLLHRSETAPTVLVSTGYDIGLRASRSEPTRLLEGNQVTVEHRFFAPSRPDGASWKRLNVQQAAADNHRVVRALRAIYPGPWVSTGASKGGMTSVYHRRFYPRDVVATVAYVAPHDVDNDVDAHGEFLAGVGTSAACRQALASVQRQALERRAELVARLESYAAQNGETFVGGIERSLEVMVVDTPFIFWQYGGQGDCGRIPGEGASASELYAFIDRTVGVASYTHRDADRYIPYYYQAATQLGYPQVNVDHLADLLTYEDVQEPRFYVPEELEPTYRDLAMRDIDEWVKGSAERIMLIYGEYDPWSAEQFEFGPGTRDSVRYLVPRANHGAMIGQLPAAERAQATATLRGWVGLSREPDERAIAPGELDATDRLMELRPRL